MTRTSKTLATGIAALCKSTVLMVGVPLALVRMWMLASGGTSPFEHASWEGQDAWGHGALALVTFVWCVAACRLARDLARALRGSLASPSASWSARWASRIVGLALLASAGTAAGAGAASAAVAPPRVIASPALAAATSADAAPRAPVQAASTTYVVRPGDCLASIAARELGSADDWPALARANMGRLQPDGRRMTDASLIYPGWVMVLPEQDTATHGGVPLAVEPPGPATAVRARPSPPPAPSPDPGPAPVARVRPIAPPAHVQSTSPSARTVATTRFAPTAGADRRSGAPPARQLAELGVLGLGILTTAAVARRLRVLRRIGECLRRPGEQLAAPSDTLGPAAAAVDPLAEAELIDWVESANRLLWRCYADAPAVRELPEIRLVRAGPDGVELLLVEPLADAPDGFVPLDGGRRWALDASLGLAELDAMTEGCGRYVPELVPVGDAEDATYLVALGPGRRLALDARGAGSVAAELAEILVALRTLPWAAELQVELVGIGEGAGAPLAAERCHRLNTSSPTEIAEIARTLPADRRRRLAATWSSELLVVAGEPRPSGFDEELLQAVGRVAGVISVGGPATARLAVSEGSLLLEPDGIALRRTSPSGEQIALAGKLLAGAAADPLVCPNAGRAVGRVGEDRGPAVDLGRADAPGPVEVRILSRTPGVEGWSSRPSSKDHGRVVELLAYLALHDHEATTDRIRDAVFSRGDRVASLGRVHNVCSAARTALGTAPDGHAYLPASTGGRYRLDSSVSSDWLRFESMRSAAARSEASVAFALLAEALSLVEGAPLADVASGWDWVLAEGLLTTMVSSIVDASHHLASLAIATGDVERARWALARGRAVEPWSEILARDAMVVADLDGDPDAVRRAWRELEAGLDRLDGNEPSAETRALYEELCEPRRRLAGAGSAGS